MTTNLLLKRAGQTGNPVRTLNLQRTLLCCAALLLGAFSAPHSAQASDPVGIYAFVDKIVFEPDTNAPQRVLVWGGFALAEGSGDNYATAKRGYMYFSLTPGKEKACRNEWNDLRSVAGTSQIVGFGFRYKLGSKVRDPKAKAENPDPYPIEMGVIKLTDAKASRRTPDYKPIQELRALMPEKTAPVAPKAQTKSSS